ncbi:MAG: winged helix-turn-helix domain-containing protein [Patescibacteria group bacterium]
MKQADDSGRFGIEQLFGSRTRSRLMQIFLKSPDEKFFVRELMRKIDAQLNSVRRELSNLVELGFVVEMDEPTEGKKAERKKYYSVNKNFTLYEELRALFLKAGVLIQQDLVKTLLVDPAIQVLALTGLFVGKADAETDILIIGNPDTRGLQERVKSFEQILGREVNYTVMPADEYLYRRDISDRFLASIFQTDHVVMYDALTP